MILIDTREPVERVCESFIETGFTDFRLETLHNGADYLVQTDGGELAVQRKTANDFLGSLDGLKGTLQDLRDHYETSALLIEGNRRAAGSNVAVYRGRLQQTSVGSKTWHNFLLSQQLRGTLYMRTLGLKDTCRALAYAQDYIDDSIEPPRDGVESGTQIIGLFPGIGPTKADRIIDHFGDPATALASIRLWSDVGGIGEKTQEGIIEWLIQN